MGAVQAGVGMVTGYPGAPVTPVVDHIIEMTDAEAPQANSFRNIFCPP